MLNAERLSFGYLLPTRDAVMFATPAAKPLLALGEQAEELGFEAIWAGDGPLARPRHDALLMLTALAARTERVTLATGVLLGALRPALLLAQAGATLDQISEGRFVMGLGRPEYERALRRLRQDRARHRWLARHRSDDRPRPGAGGGERGRLLTQGRGRQGRRRRAYQLRRWDFFHCPAGVEHVFVGAGDGPCAVLMIGSRRLDEAHYPVNETAAKYDASVPEATDEPDEAYSEWREAQWQRVPSPWPLSTTR